jgi:hypothetical protein
MVFLAKRRFVRGDAGQTWKENIMVCKNTATNSIFKNGGIQVEGSVTTIISFEISRSLCSAKQIKD